MTKTVQIRMISNPTSVVNKQQVSSDAGRLQCDTLARSMVERANVDTRDVYVTVVQTNTGICLYKFTL